MIATNRSGMRRSPPIAVSDTLAWMGFVQDRTKVRRSGSPSEATSRPEASQTATWPRWTDSSSPERTTRMSGSAERIGARSAQGEGRVVLVAALQFVLQDVQHVDHGAPVLRDAVLFG